MKRFIYYGTYGAFLGALLGVAGYNVLHWQYWACFAVFIGFDIIRDHV